MLYFLILPLFFLQSCVGMLLGGTVALGGKALVRDDYKVFNSKIVWQAQQDLNKTLAKIKTCHTNEIVIVQDRNKIYTAGIVSNQKIFDASEAVLQKYFKNTHISEVQIETINRNKILDFYLKTKILNTMLFTKYIRSGNYNVLVFNEIAYIFGEATNQNEEKILTKALSEIEGINDIIIYIS